MDVKHAINNIKKIKNFLVFFYAAFLLLGCRNTEQADTPIVEYEGNKAVRVLFKSEVAHKDLSVHHLKNRSVPILGDFLEKDGYISFTPIIPFSKDQQYIIAHNEKQISHFKVESKGKPKNPSLIAIYPKHDTVPMNILKMYLEFSEPMQHVGNPLDFITVLDKTENIKAYPFLDLEAELWNTDHTRLTLWFDPGRIKTGLIPNQERGLPLKQNHSYVITIDKEWKSASGTPLEHSFSKTIHVVEKDITSPNPENWTISIPKNNTQSPLEISLDDALDPILALENIKLFRGDISLEGSLELSNENKVLRFKPIHPWKRGDYLVLIHPVLEDISGNNLNSLFDSDLRNLGKDKDIVTTLRFSIY